VNFIPEVHCVCVDLAEMKELVRNAWAKINLHLQVLRRREDGFHEIESLFYPIHHLADRLRFQIGQPGIKIFCSNPRIPTGPENLIWKAVKRFYEQIGRPAEVRISLEKRIPVGAGLGGGSSNAAQTLLALNILYDSPLENRKLQQLATEIGSDVPFFLQPFPAIVKGRGDRVEPIGRLPALESCWLVCLYPGFEVSTPWAYQSLGQEPGQPSPSSQTSSSLQDWIETFCNAHQQPAWEKLANTLEIPVFRKYPILELYREFLLENGALSARMSGSGSTVFGIFPEKAPAEQAQKKALIQFGSQIWCRLFPLFIPE